MRPMPSFFLATSQFFVRYSVMVSLGWDSRIIQKVFIFLKFLWKRSLNILLCFNLFYFVRCSDVILWVCIIGWWRLISWSTRMTVNFPFEKLASAKIRYKFAWWTWNPIHVWRALFDHKSDVSTTCQCVTVCRRCVSTGDTYLQPPLSYYPMMVAFRVPKWA